MEKGRVHAINKKKKCYVNANRSVVTYAFDIFRKAPPNAAKARKHRIYFLESLLNASSTALVDMAAELSDAEEREHAFTDQTRWHNFQNLSEVKLLLQHAFNAAASARFSLFPLLNICM
jgi:hypothetical protein